MGSKMYWKPSVDDIQNEGCDETEVEMLCDIFESRMREMACSRVAPCTISLAIMES